MFDAKRAWWHRPLWYHSSLRQCTAWLVGSMCVLSFAGCGGASLAGRPTVQPVLAFTPVPTQNVGATATAYARRSLPTPTPSNVYVVRTGDTLTKIADNYETTIDEIMAANNLSDPNRIAVGQQLRIPASGTTATASTTALP